MKQNEFNEIVVSVIEKAMRPPPDGPEMQNWVSTQFGRRFGGTEIECDNLPEICPGCNEAKPDIAKRRLNAAYADDDLNWLVSCRDCFNEEQSRLGEMWDDYWSMVI